MKQPPNKGGAGNKGGFGGKGGKGGFGGKGGRGQDLGPPERVIRKMSSFDFPKCVSCWRSFPYLPK